jgi:hypothetical protein
MTGVQEPALELQPNVRIDRYSVSLLPPGHPQYRYYAITVERRQPNTAGHVWALTDGIRTAADVAAEWHQTTVEQM